MIPVSLTQRLIGVAMITAGAAIAVVFGGGLLLFLWEEIAAGIRGSPRPMNLMSILLIGPLVGVAPALLGVALARRGWQRCRPQSLAEPEDAP
ncbi:hypothetical protein [uncultured Phenylobacterium sp.]|uniref:hypothetical protein n=1 Tax=uncultured Phenylobacterium sp. TaxID=349273 RepID=UPI0025FA5011|nr:hypothetical protein [uncultured Phenylobacterium sp.]